MTSVIQPAIDYLVGPYYYGRCRVSCAWPLQKTCSTCFIMVTYDFKTEIFSFAARGAGSCPCQVVSLLS